MRVFDMEVKSYDMQDTLEKLCNLLDNRDKVYYPRFGDGDFNIMTNNGRCIEHDYSEELQKELRESFDRVEGIIIKLIDQQKKVQIGQKGLERSYRAMVEIIARLSGNGLKDKFMRIQEKDGDDY